MNFFTLSTCDLLRYEGSSLGLTKYKDEGGDCTTFVDLEDHALGVATNAAKTALVLGLLFLPVIIIHNFIHKIPYNDIVLSMIGGVIQFCLLMVYTAKNNAICEVESCSWGHGGTWLVLSELMFLSASIGAIYTSNDTIWTKNQEHSIRRRHRELITEPEVGY